MKIERRKMLGMISAAAGAAMLPGGADSLAAQAPASGSAKAQSSPASKAEPAREKVLGFGGFFFRAKDPKGLGQWYQDHLGIDMTPTTMTGSVWEQQAGQTFFTPFAETTKYFGDASKQWMLNFRIRDMDAMAAQLTAAGIAIKIDPQIYPNGRFARIHDPEGNPVELWQPMGPGAKA